MRSRFLWRVVEGPDEDLLIQLDPAGCPVVDSRGYPAVVVPYPKGFYDPAATDQVLRNVPSFRGDLDALCEAVAAALDARAGRGHD